MGWAPLVGAGEGPIAICYLANAAGALRRRIIWYSFGANKDSDIVTGWDFATPTGKLDSGIPETGGNCESDGEGGAL